MDAWNAECQAITGAVSAAQAAKQVCHACMLRTSHSQNQYTPVIMHCTSPKCEGVRMLEIFMRSVGIKICNVVAKSGSGGEVRQRTDAAAGGGGRARRQIGG